MNQLSGKVAVVTGAASGIGRALAHAFAAEGMHLVVSDVDEQRLALVVAQLAEDGAQVASLRVDTSVEADVQQLAETALQRFGGAHVLCNNAGVWGKGDAWTGPISTWDWVIGVNLYGVIHGIRAFLPIMQEQGEGHIVNTASIAGLIAVPGAAPYNATKSAIVAISEGLFIQLKATGSPIGVSVLVPGSVHTDLMRTGSWPERLGGEPAPTSDPISQAIDTSLAESLETGMAPAELAAHALAAVREGRFWVFTHPELATMPVERMQRAVAQQNPA
ncbi:MAG: putative oxidoreductase [Ilumatobacteraceae bacterium]|nr:putative oxidoreductase [Ilumatobacteraceae bacterium]